MVFKGKNAGEFRGLHRPPGGAEGLSPVVGVAPPEAVEFATI